MDLKLRLGLRELREASECVDFERFVWTSVIIGWKVGAVGPAAGGGGEGDGCQRPHQSGVRSTLTYEVLPGHRHGVYMIFFLGNDMLLLR